MVHVVVTGGAGFLGTRLARELLAAGTLGVAGDAPRPLSRLTLIDQAPIAAGLAADDRVTGVRADLSGLLADGADGDSGNPLAGADVIFHLAAAVSAECEADFDLGMRANVAATQALLAACRALGTRPVVVYASSLAVFGGSARHPLPAVVDDQTAPNPQTSYGTHKLIGEHLLADYTRKGFLRGRAMRLMTVCVRPGRPNAAASGFLSGIIREPLAGQRATCPVPPATEVALASPAAAITALLRAATSTGQAWGDHTAVTMPALTVTVAEMAAALERVAGREIAALIDWVPDPAIAAIVTGWPARVRAERAARLGLTPDADFESIVRMHAAQFGIKRFLSGTEGGICIRPCFTRLTIVIKAPLALAVAAVAVAAALGWIGPFKPSVATAASPAAASAVVCASATRPALAAAMARDISAARRGRSSTVALWVDAPGAGLTCSLNGSAHFDSASTVKVTILAALLRKALDQHRYLTSREASLARAMITMSSNDAASALWAELGPASLQHFLDLAGMTQTVLGPGGYWGLTQVTSRDESLLLRMLATPGTVLDGRSRAYALGLMAAVIPAQRWGTPAGAPRSVIAHVKNGWLPRATHGWRIHSLGAFTWPAGWYSIVVLTQDNPTMAYGITTIETIARAIHHDLNPAVTSVIPPSSAAPSWGTPDETIPALPALP